MRRPLESTVIPYVLIAPYYFAGKIPLGGMTQTAGAFDQVATTMSFFITLYTTLADYKAVVDRLTSFDEAIDRALEAGAESALTAREGATPELRIDDLSLGLPDGRRILEAHGLALNEAGTQAKARLGTTLNASAVGLIKNPIMLAILTGTLLSAFGIGLPAPVLKTVDLFAAASAPVALFAIGASLVGLQVRGLGGDAGQIVIGKLLIHPLLVYFGFRLVGPVDPALKSTGIIMASMPMVSIYPLLGQRYGLGDMCAAALLISTMVSVLTITLVIWLVGP